MKWRGPSVRLVRHGVLAPLTRAHGADTGLDRMSAQGAAPKPATPLVVWRAKQHTRPCTVSEESKAWRHGLDQHLPKGEIPSFIQKKRTLFLLNKRRDHPQTDQLGDGGDNSISSGFRFGVLYAAALRVADKQRPKDERKSPRCH